MDRFEAWPGPGRVQDPSESDYGQYSQSQPSNLNSSAYSTRTVEQDLPRRIPTHSSSNIPNSQIDTRSGFHEQSYITDQQRMSQYKTTDRIDMQYQNRSNLDYARPFSSDHTEPQYQARSIPDYRRSSYLPPDDIDSQYPTRTYPDNRKPFSPDFVDSNYKIRPNPDYRGSFSSGHDDSQHKVGSNSNYPRPSLDQNSPAEIGLTVNYYDPIPTDAHISSGPESKSNQFEVQRYHLQGDHKSLPGHVVKPQFPKHTTTDPRESSQGSSHPVLQPRMIQQEAKPVTHPSSSKQTEDEGSTVDILRKKPLFGQVKEYINELMGLVEVKKIGDKMLTPAATVFFHVTSVWISDPKNPGFEPPIRIFETDYKLEETLPVGTRVILMAQQVESSYFVLGALCVWPIISMTPSIISDPLLSKELEYYIARFEEKPPSLVQATFPKFPYPDDEYASAQIWQVKYDDYGTIMLKGNAEGKPYQFQALFHKSQVFLHDGRRLMDSEFRDKPLDSILDLDQPVSLTARSIIATSGAQLESSFIELQAITVSLNPNKFPETVSWPTMLQQGTGAYGLGPQPTLYYFRSDLRLKLNALLVKYVELWHQEKNEEIPELNPECLTLEEKVENLKEVSTIFELSENGDEEVKTFGSQTSTIKPSEQNLTSSSIGGTVAKSSATRDKSPTSDVEILDVICHEKKKVPPPPPVLGKMPTTSGSRSIESARNDSSPQPPDIGRRTPGRQKSRLDSPRDGSRRYYRSGLSPGRRSKRSFSRSSPRSRSSSRSGSSTPVKESFRRRTSKRSASRGSSNERRAKKSRSGSPTTIYSISRSRSRKQTRDFQSSKSRGKRSHRSRSRSPFYSSRTRSHSRELLSRERQSAEWVLMPSSKRSNSRERSAERLRNRIGRSSSSSSGGGNSLKIISPKTISTNQKESDRLRTAENALRQSIAMISKRAQPYLQPQYVASQLQPVQRPPVLPVQQPYVLPVQQPYVLPIQQVHPHSQNPVNLKYPPVEPSSTRSESAAGSSSNKFDQGKVQPPPLVGIGSIRSYVYRQDTENSNTSDVDEGQRCPFCDERNHISTDCKIYAQADLDQKKKLVLSKDLCTHCLYPGHVPKMCKNNRDKLCDIDGCKSFHHPSLHPSTMWKPSTNKCWCVYCDMFDHTWSSCPSYKAENCQQRSLRIKSKKLCKSCLQQGHPQSQCKNTWMKKCPCRGDHHPSLHVDQKKKPASRIEAPVPNQEVTEGTTNVCLLCKTPGHTHTNCTINKAKDKSVVLTRLCDHCLGIGKTNQSCNFCEKKISLPGGCPFHHPRVHKINSGGKVCDPKNLLVDAAPPSDSMCGKILEMSALLTSRPPDKVKQAVKPKSKKAAKEASKEFFSWRSFISDTMNAEVTKEPKSKASQKETDFNPDANPAMSDPVDPAKSCAEMDPIESNLGNDPNKSNPGDNPLESNAVDAPTQSNPSDIATLYNYNLPKTVVSNALVPSASYFTEDKSKSIVKPRGYLIGEADSEVQVIKECRSIEQEPDGEEQFLQIVKEVKRSEKVDKPNVQPGASNPETGFTDWKSFIANAKFTAGNLKDSKPSNLNTVNKEKGKNLESNYKDVWDNSYSPCPFCEKSDHLSIDCKIYLQADTNQRKKMVFSRKLCTLCIYPGHAIKLCPERKDETCGIDNCKFYHHPSLHMSAKKLHVSTQNKCDSLYSLCPFCESSDHLSSLCQKYTNLNMNQKKEIVFAKKLCSHCLYPGHVCPKDKDKICGIDNCKLFHHRSLHPTFRLCPFCDKSDHVSTDCKTYSDLSGLHRRTIANTKNLCDLCLYPGHTIKMCPEFKAETCGIDNCKMYHHPSLHLQADNKYSETNKDSKTNKYRAYPVLIKAQGRLRGAYLKKINWTPQKSYILFDPDNAEYLVELSVYKMFIKEVINEGIMGININFANGSVQICSPLGHVIIFDSLHQIPPEVKELIEDKFIRKPMFEAETAVKFLQSSGIVLTGWIEMENLINVYFPVSKNTFKNEVSFVKRQRNQYFEACHSGLKIDQSVLCQTVVLTVYLPFQAALLAEFRDSCPSHHIISIMHLFMNTLYEVPVIKEHFISDWFVLRQQVSPWKPWSESRQKEVRGYLYVLSLEKLTNLRLADIYYDSKGSVKIPCRAPFEEDILTTAKKIWESRQFPNPVICSRTSKFMELQYLKNEAIPEPEVRCDYYLCRDFGHSLKFCPVLHGVCEICSLRGHTAKYHIKYDVIILEQIFLEFAPGGLLTSIPFLELDPKFKIPEEFWVFGLYNNFKDESLKLQLMMGIEQQTEDNREYVKTN